MSSSWARHGALPWGPSLVHKRLAKAIRHEGPWHNSVFQLCSRGQMVDSILWRKSVAWFDAPGSKPKHVKGRHGFVRPRKGIDPSAGSPTETLLRLLLPLNDKVQWTSHNVAGSEPPTSPQSEHFTGPFNR